jgi:CrcB protein
MDRRRATSIAIGGVLGAALRWAVLTATSGPGRFPGPVLAVNVVGSCILGVLLAEARPAGPRTRLVLHDGGGIGFCGGLTTFSTFTVELAELIRDGAIGLALVYGVLSLVLCVAGVWVGHAAGHGVARRLVGPGADRS